MAKMMTLSFKDNEMDLFNYVKSKSSPSIYIKELIEKDINGIVPSTGHNEKKQDETKASKPNSINLSALKSAGR